MAKASGNHPTLTWTVTSGSYRVVVMNTDAAAPVAFAGGLNLTIPHSFAIGIGLLIGGLVLVLIAIVLIVLGARARPRPQSRPVPDPAAGALARPGAHWTLPGVGAGHRRRDSRTPACLRWSCDAIGVPAVTANGRLATIRTAVMIFTSIL